MNQSYREGKLRRTFYLTLRIVVQDLYQNPNVNFIKTPWDLDFEDRSWDPNSQSQLRSSNSKSQGSDSSNPSSQLFIKLILKTPSLTKAPIPPPSPILKLQRLRNLQMLQTLQTLQSLQTLQNASKPPKPPKPPSQSLQSLQLHDPNLAITNGNAKIAQSQRCSVAAP